MTISENYLDELNAISPLKYQRLMYGSWVTEALTPREQLLETLAKEYHDRCDAYDARVCTAISPRTGEPIPATGRELGAINANSRAVRNDILARNGITEKELHEAIVRYGQSERR
jgi:hypothetical protein